MPLSSTPLIEAPIKLQPHPLGLRRRRPNRKPYTTTNRTEAQQGWEFHELWYPTPSLLTGGGFNKIDIIVAPDPWPTITDGDYRDRAQR